MSKTAVVLFNLGGPDSPEAVQPFLFNLFNDAAIIGLPSPLRWLLAKTISRRRAPVAREIYAELGGSSPLLGNTNAQAAALETRLRARRGGQEGEIRAFVVMRYWHPRSAAVAREVRAFRPERLVLLPLYPQFSTTTSASSLRDWREAARRQGIAAPGTTVCCYPQLDGLIAELASGTAAALREAAAKGPPRVLFSAHGLPRKIVAAGDPYQWQVEQTAAAIVAALRKDHGVGEDLDWLVSYQSRVGPLEWIKPYTENEIERAGRDGVPLVVVPVAFVSEHSETLVELDIEYRRLAERAGVPAYLRVPTVGTGSAFVAGLAELVTAALASGRVVASASGGRICPAAFGRCPHRG